MSSSDGATSESSEAAGRIAGGASEAGAVVGIKGGSWTSEMGRVRIKALPFPDSLSTQICPP
jgi:hypothetical protein